MHAAPLNALRTSSPQTTSILSQKLGNKIDFSATPVKSWALCEKSDKSLDNDERQVVPASDKPHTEMLRKR